MIIKRTHESVLIYTLQDYDALYAFLVSENRKGNLSKAEIQSCYLLLQQGYTCYSSNNEGRVTYKLEQ